MQLSPFLRCFPYHRSPFQGTHGDRVAGDNTRSRHNQRHFSYYATSPAWQLRNRRPRILVLFVKSDARFARRRCGSCSVFEVAHTVYKYAPNRLLVIINYKKNAINRCITRKARFVPKPNVQDVRDFGTSRA